VRQGEGPALRAVGFRMAEYADRLRGAQNVSIAYTPNVNEWNGYRNVELMLEDVKFE
jgi:hypothetical protein